jgi:hypothetical protein
MHTFSKLCKTSLVISHKFIAAEIYGSGNNTSTLKQITPFRTCQFTVSFTAEAFGGKWAP